MNRFVLFLTIYCISSSLFAQTQSKSFKVKNQTTTRYSTSFTPLMINGQSHLKSAKLANVPGPFQKINLKTFKVPPIQANDKRIVFGKDSIAPIFFEHDNPSALKSANMQTPEQRCFSFLENIKDDLHITNPRQCFTITDSKNDTLGQQHIRLSQRYHGVKVYNADFYVHFAGSKEIMNGKYSVIGALQNTKPKITKEQALQIAVDDLKSKTTITEFTDAQKVFLNYYAPQIDTVILDDKKSFTKYSLAYHVIIRPNFIDEWYYFVNAENGSIIKNYNNTKTDGPVTATSTDLNGVSRSINTYLEKGLYYMVDASEPMFNSTNKEGLIETLDAQNSTGNKYVDISSVNNTWSNPTAVSAHYNAKQAYLYYKNTFGRNSVNGSGGTMVSFINVANADGSGLDNAFWSDKYMYYGNGNIAFTPTAGGLDVAAHEMTHGVTQNTANLEYLGESGAINESISDIFGAMVDRSNWYIGEAITKTSFIASGRLRDMSNPHNGTTNGFAGWQPMHTNEMYLGDEDHGGVHTNSGISNYAYYLFATAITKEKAEKIYYRALTTYLTKSSQFVDLRIAIEQSTKDLYGDNSNELAQAKKAFDAVGIYEDQPTSTSETYPANPGQDYLLIDNTDPSDANTLYRSTVTASTFSPLSKTVMLNRACVVDNGSVAGFVAANHTIHSITLDPTNPVETVISSDAIWKNVAVSKDGKRMAAITNATDTAIFVYDFITNKWAKFRLYNPTTEGTSNKGGVLYADALEFDHTGEYLIYDAYNVIRSTSTDSISYWDIGLIKIWDNQQNTFGDGTIAKLFSNLPDSVSVGDPTFSKNSPNIIAFDLLKGNNIFAIIGLNLETSDMGIIATNNTIGNPSYAKLDNKIVYNSIDNTGHQIINTVNLNADMISSTATPVTIITDAKWPVYYATGTRVLGFAPKADFSASYLTGKAPLSTKFLDQSTNNPTAWEWTFASGTPQTSTDQNPVVTYSAPGTYAVSLKVTNSFGNNTVTKSAFIVVSKATGIDVATSTVAFKVYPNPTLGLAEISIDEPLESDYKIEVYNYLGSLVQTYIKQKTELLSSIDLSGNPSGIYLIKITMKDKTFISRIIKK